MPSSSSHDRPPRTSCSRSAARLLRSTRFRAASRFETHCRGPPPARCAWESMTSTLEPAAAEQEIARIVRDELLLGSEREIPLDQPLGELGVGLDSLALVNLLTAVEGAFGVELSDDT